MKKFQFTLDAAARWRQHLLSQEKLRLQSMERQLQQIAGQLEQNTRDLTDNWVPLVTTAEALHQVQAYRQALKKQADQLQIQYADQTAANKLQALKVIEADRNSRVLDKLRAKQYTEWQSALAKKMEEEAADLYSSKLVRQNNL